MLDQGRAFRGQVTPRASSPWSAGRALPERDARRSFVPGVALEDVRALQEELARLALDLQPHAPDRHAARAGLPRPRERVAEQHAGLAHAVALEDPRAERALEREEALGGER